MPIVNDVYLCTMEGDRPVRASFTLETIEPLLNTDTEYFLALGSGRETDPGMLIGNRRKLGIMAAEALVQLINPPHPELLREAALSLRSQVESINGLSHMKLGEVFMDEMNRIIPSLTEDSNE